MSAARDLLNRVRSHDVNSKPSKHYFVKLDKAINKWRIYRSHKDGSITSDGRTYNTRFAATLQMNSYTHHEHVTGEPHTLDGQSWPGYQKDNNDGGMPDVPLGGVIGS